MKVKRELTIHDHDLRVGDRIKVKLPTETHWATAYKKNGSVLHFIFDDCLDELRPMNSENTTEGGYEASELRTYLKKLGEQIPEKLKKKMIPDENGDLLFLLDLREVCGCNEKWEEAGGQLNFFKDRRNKGVSCKEDKYANWWLRDVVSSPEFAYVNNYGYCGTCSASNASIGVRPAFALSTDL